jgi:hypothetical protein
MIEHLENLPYNVAGFRASQKVTKDDFKNTLLPKVKELVDKTDKLNYILVLDTSIRNFTLGAWIQDLILGIKYFTKWRRIAIVTDVNSIRIFTKYHSYFMPGEYRGYKHNDLQKAVDWISSINK